MLINFSNHPSKDWKPEQLEAAKAYGEIKDIAFPAIAPYADYNEIQALANGYVKEILSLAEGQQTTVHVMGEMTFVFNVVSLLKEKGIECIASTTDRNTEMLSDSQKISDFQFVRFRKY